MKTEDKERFKALYLNQQVGRVLGVGDYSTWLVYAENLIVIDYLELTILSDITDEHAIEVAKILGVDQCTAIEAKDNILKYSPHLRSLEVADFLRKHGYAVPFDGNSVEKMISMGWMKYKD